MSRYRVRSGTTVVVAGIQHAAGSTLEAEPGEVQTLVAAGDLVAVPKAVRETKEHV